MEHHQAEPELMTAKTARCLAIEQEAADAIASLVPVNRQVVGHPPLQITPQWCRDIHASAGVIGIPLGFSAICEAEFLRFMQGAGKDVRLAIKSAHCRYRLQVAQF